MAEHIRHADETPDLPEEQRLATDAKNLIKMSELQTERLNRPVEPIAMARRLDENITALQAAIDKERKNVSPAVAAVIEGEDGSGEASEKSPEQLWFTGFEKRFNDPKLSKLHKGIVWADVKRCIEADAELVKNLMAFDEKGLGMNVFGEEGDEFIFATAWTDYQQVSEDCRNISFDAEGEKLAREIGLNPNGNAVKIIADIMGIEEEDAAKYLADPELHKQLIKAISVNGGAWLKTDADTRAAGSAIRGRAYGVRRDGANYCYGAGSLRAALRGKKA